MSLTKAKLKLTIIKWGKTVSFQNKKGNGTDVFGHLAQLIITSNKINSFKVNQGNASQGNLVKIKENCSIWIEKNKLILLGLASIYSITKNAGPPPTKGGNHLLKPKSLAMATSHALSLPGLGFINCLILLQIKEAIQISQIKTI